MLHRKRGGVIDIERGGHRESFTSPAAGQPNPGLEMLLGSNGMTQFSSIAIAGIERRI